MTVKTDQYKECNDQPELPLEDFQRQFCSRCIRPDCTRSQHGKSKFDQRITTWESRLFLDVPRMDAGDTRLKVLQAKRFHTVDIGRPREVQSWIDPRDMEELGPGTYEVPKAEQIEVDTAVDLDEQEPKYVESKVSPALPTLKNTSNRRGQMLGGKKDDEKSPQPVFDPWEQRKPPKGTVVKPGAKIRLRGSEPGVGEK